ncbi:MULTISPECIES: transcription termination/antitermination protein NusG [unclassified Exiguobacterium]|uniref:transcription termination/antitermination protein NusG n=1 Tax=unclassified Exiguobacterium TaxID=2644629 RepID=UPI000ED38CB6|nr:MULTISPECIES: transcription termination/antitermination protein NusG [unclassified Exiguobacterium]MDT0174254.1 transcription termination/antitermination protein NusG [Exiguobacterium sp. BRG2]HAL00752.1 transcription termination/antitermination protein NusG [Exiguobacterium sp.]
MEKQWFVVQTYSGFENNVKANLERRIESMNMDEKIFRVLVPIETVQEEVTNKKGETKIKEREVKIFPGYVLVEMVMTDDSWYVVRNTPNVTGFLGSVGGGSKPTPLLPEEAENILGSMGLVDLKSRYDFSLGQIVRIKEGAFENLEGTIEELDADAEKMKVSVDMFGRETKVELDFAQVDKID